ncbi:MAG: PqiC family protein, partial [Candidatus Accumulibacter sp.]|nr:PqiC family protein [Accumulibacter sp.]
MKTTLRPARLFLLPPLLLGLLLAGCAGLPREGAPVKVYDFGQPGDAQTPGDAADLAGRIALDVRAAPWLNGPEIDYRLAYGDPFRRSQYAGSRWAAPPALLLAQQLRRQVGFAAVDSVAADCVLRVELQEFSQVFSAPQASRGTLLGQVSLIDGKRRPIAGYAVGIERPAPEPDAAGGVQALVEASHELGRQIADWLHRLKTENG